MKHCGFSKFFLVATVFSSFLWPRLSIASEKPPFYDLGGPCQKNLLGANYTPTFREASDAEEKKQWKKAIANWNLIVRSSCENQIHFWGQVQFCSVALRDE